MKGGGETMSRDYKKNIIKNLVMALQQCQDRDIFITVRTMDDDCNDTGYYAQTIEFYDYSSTATYPGLDAVYEYVEEFGYCERETLSFNPYIYGEDFGWYLDDDE